MRILIAEDDLTSRIVLMGVLKKQGHEVVATVNGMEALTAMQQPDAPRLAILDWMMPELDGVEVCRRIRAQETDRQLYIIILTSKDEKTDIITGLEGGANDYLAKPFDPGELHARIEVGRRMIEMEDALIESREILTHKATHDSLTSLLNRQAILGQLREELARAGRHRDLLAVGMCDIDHFKNINDTYGHPTGDDVLCGLAQILIKILRKYDSVGRMGGDEFLVIFPMKAGADCEPIFKRICERIAASKITTRSGVLSVTVSIGVSCAAAESKVDEMLETADKELYRAKNEGRNRVAYNRKCIFEGNHPGIS
jgi:two-component system, cell cycle response regulator